MTCAGTRSALSGLVLVALLAGCGKVGSLDRTPGMSPQPIAYGAQKAENVNQLIKPSTQADPGRMGRFINSAVERRTETFEVYPGVAPRPFPGDPLTGDFGGETVDDEPNDDGA